MDKVKIAICDDQQEMILLLKKHLMRLQQEKHCEWTVKAFLSGEALLREIKDFQVVLLDIEMPGMDGIETGRQALLQNPQCKLIMATGAVERFKEAFRIQAFRFITKPYEPAEIREALEAALEDAAGTETIEIYNNRNAYSVKQREIFYIRAFNGYSEFEVDGKQFRREESLGELEEILDDRLFVRIHRQYIINMAVIDAYRNGSVFIGGKEFPVSRRIKKEFEQKYTQFQLKNTFS